MNLLYTTIGNFQTFESQENIANWRKQYHIIETLPIERLTAYLRFDISSSLALVDAIVCAADTDMTFSFPITTALKLAEDVRSLPEKCAMRDCRKWKSIPFIILHNSVNFELTPGEEINTHAHLIVQSHSDLTLRKIQAIVDRYQDRVLQDYENVGMWLEVKGTSA